jgi:hypothetical protein
MAANRWQSRLVLLAKVLVAAGLLTFLFVQAQRHDSFATLRDGPKEWRFLFAAGGLCFVAVIITFVRWYLLVWALDIPFRLRDAFRLSFLAYLLNFVSLGSVGGDLFKALFIAREQPTRRTEAVATVVIDRLFGLLALFLVASAAILLTDVRVSVHEPIVHGIVNATLVATAVGVVVMALLLWPGLVGSRLVGRMRRVKWIGPIMARVVGAVEIYQRKLPLLGVILAMSVAVHVLLILGFYFIARGLPSRAPTFSEHFLVIPLSMVAGSLPFTPNGLGTLELGVDYFYRTISSSGGVTPGDGVIAALCYRIITVAIALVGVCYYLTRSREIDEAMQEADG